MNADNTMHIVLPFVDLRSIRAAFPVARVMARTLNGRLHVLAAAAHAPTLRDFARRMSLSPDDQETIAIEAASGNLIDAMLHKVRTSRQAIVVLAARFREDAPGVKVQAIETIGRQVLEKIARPILIVPPDRDMTAWRWRRELLPQDGTPGCAGALAQIINRSSQLGIENLVLRVAGANVGQPTEPGSLATPRYVDHPQYEWEIWGREFLDRIRGMGTRLDDGRLMVLMARGEPGEETLRVAREKDVDMIVLPWHCAIGSGRARLVKTVLQGATCPVLLLPERDSPRCINDE